MSAVADDLADPVDVEEDELALEDKLPESEGGGVQLTAGGRARPILSAMQSLGPCTSSEIAAKLGRNPANISTQLRQYEERNEVHRTGRSVNQPGQRGGPQIEWEIGAGPNGSGTGPADSTALPPSTLEVERERVRSLTARVEDLSGQVEAREDERDSARQDLRELRDELRVRGAQLGELEQETERLRAVERRLREELAAPRDTPTAAAVPVTDGRPEMRRAYFDLLLAQAGRDDAPEHIYDRIERLVDGPILVEQD